MTGQPTVLAERAWAPSLIVGAPRSGTTLLAVMLARHSQISVGPETHFFHTFLPRVPANVAADPDRLLDRALLDRRISDLGLERAQVESRLRVPYTGPGDLFTALMDAHAALQGKRRWCEKSPDHIFHVEEIRRHLPTVRLICCLRDGRDVALSLDRVPWRRGSLWGHASLWLRAAREIERLLREGDFSRVLLVRYEDMVADPGRTLASVTDFLDVRFEDAMLQGSPTDAAVIPAREHAWKMKAADQLDDSRIGAWRTQATPRQRCVMNLVEGEALRHFGYAETDTNGCSLRLRIEHLARRLLDHRAVRRAWGRLRGHRSTTRSDSLPEAPPD